VAVRSTSGLAAPATSSVLPKKSGSLGTRQHDAETFGSSPKMMYTACSWMRVRSLDLRLLERKVIGEAQDCGDHARDVIATIFFVCVDIRKLVPQATKHLGDGQ
jgi:hypothetical protein